jgi:hypothetical protein
MSMSIRFAMAKRYSLVVCALVGGAACDLIAEAGQTLTLANQTTVLGSVGNAQTPPRPAVDVRPGGTVVVQDATLLGGGVLVQQAGQQSFGAAGPGISAPDGNGTIRVQQGLVSGGPVIVRVAGEAFDDPAPGIQTLDATLEIGGGTLRGGALVSEVGPLADGLPAPALLTQGGTVRMLGGSLGAGSLPAEIAGDGPSMVALESQLEIVGGSYGDEVLSADGRARILGGTFESLHLVSSSPDGCSELRGGQMGELVVVGGRVIVAGTALELAPTRQIGVSILTGTLENGQAVNAEVVLDEGAAVQLVAAGSPGCP